MTRRTLIVEVDGRGHRFYYVRVLAELALRRGDQVTVLTGDAEHTDAHLAAHLGGLLDRVDLIRSHAPTWATVEDTARRLDAAVTVVPEADGFLVDLLRRRGWRARGTLSLLVMRAQIAGGAHPVRRFLASTVKRLSMHAAVRFPGVRLHVLRSGLWSGRSPWPAACDPVGFTASPRDVAELRAQWSLDPDRHWFGIVGSITPNKHADVVARALAAIDSPGTCGLLVAGVVADPVRQQLADLAPSLAEAGVAVRVVDRLLGDTELDAAIAAIDTLVLAYAHLGPSGTFAKALAAGTRVVAAGSPVLRDDCAGVPGSAEWVPLTTGDLTAAMTRARSLAAPAPLVIATEDAFAAALLGPVGAVPAHHTPPTSPERSFG